MRRVEITPPQLRPFLQPLRVPTSSGMMAVLPLNNSVELTAEIGRQSMFKGNLSEFWSYTMTLNSNRVSNPTLVAEVGVQVNVAVTNFPGEDTTIHWHGLKVDAIIRVELKNIYGLLNTNSFENQS